MPFLFLTIALLLCAGLGLFSIVRPTLYRKISAGVLIGGGLLSGYAFGVLLTRTLLHQDWRLFQKDLLLLSFFFALLLERSTRRAAVDNAAAMPAPAGPPPPAVEAPPMPRAHQEVSSPEELRAKLATMEGKLRWTQERLNAQKEWLDGVETQYQDLMARFQDAKSDEDRSSTLEQLGRITEDRNHARSELRGTEQAFEHLELEIKAATTRLERLSAPS